MPRDFPGSGLRGVAMFDGDCGEPYLLVGRRAGGRLFILIVDNLNVAANASVCHPLSQRLALECEHCVWA